MKKYIIEKTELIKDNKLLLSFDFNYNGGNTYYYEFDTVLKRYIYMKNNLKRYMKDSLKDESFEQKYSMLELGQPTRLDEFVYEYPILKIFDPQEIQKYQTLI